MAVLTAAAVAAVTCNGRRQCKRRKKCHKRKARKEGHKVSKKKEKLGCNLACVMLFFFCSSCERTTLPPRTKKKKKKGSSTLHVQALKSSGSCPQRPQDCSFGSPEHPFPYSQTYSRAHWNICECCRRGPRSDTGSP